VSERRRPRRVRPQCHLFSRHERELLHSLQCRRLQGERVARRRRGCHCGVAAPRERRASPGGRRYLAGVPGAGRPDRTRVLSGASRKRRLGRGGRGSVVAGLVTVGGSPNVRPYARRSWGPRLIATPKLSPLADVEESMWPARDGGVPPGHLLCFVVLAAKRRKAERRDNPSIGAAATAPQLSGRPAICSRSCCVSGAVTNRTEIECEAAQPMERARKTTALANPGNSNRLVDLPPLASPEAIEPGRDLSGRHLQVQACRGRAGDAEAREGAAAPRVRRAAGHEHRPQPRQAARTHQARRTDGCHLAGADHVL
jgi:hypothetical protein